MTYVESVPANSSPLTLIPEAAAKAPSLDDFSGRVLARLKAHVGPRRYDAFFSSLKIHNVQDGRVDMSLPAINPIVHSYEPFLTSLCEQELNGAIHPIRVRHRQLDEKTGPVMDNGISLRPKRETVVTRTTQEGPVAVPETTFSAPANPPAFHELWLKVKNRYDLQQKTDGKAYVVNPLMLSDVIGDTVFLEIPAERCDEYCSIVAHTILVCWQLVMAEAGLWDIQSLCVRKIFDYSEPDVTVFVSGETDGNKHLQDLFNDVLEERTRKNIEEGTAPRILIENIQRVVAKHYKIQRTELVNQRRTRVLVKPRQIAMYLAKVLTPRSFPEIGRRFGGRDHTTVLHAVRKIEDMIRNSPLFELELNSLCIQLGTTLPPLRPALITI